MKSIIIKILAFLLVIFPFSQTFKSIYQQLSYLVEYAISDSIIEAVKTKDVEIIENMLSEEAKQRMKDPKKSISDFLNNIDGKIINAKYDGGSSEHDESGAGHVYSTRVWVIKIETTKKHIVLISCRFKKSQNPCQIGRDFFIPLDLYSTLLYYYR